MLIGRRIYITSTLSGSLITKLAQLRSLGSNSVCSAIVQASRRVNGIGEFMKFFPQPRHYVRLKAFPAKVLAYQILINYKARKHFAGHSRTRVTAGDPNTTSHGSPGSSVDAVIVEASPVDHSCPEAFAGW